MLFEVTLRQNFLSKPAINRMHFNSSGTPAAVSLSFALASALGGIPDPITSEFPAGSFMAELAGIQADDVQYAELEVRALYSVTDFYSVPYSASQTGAQTGEVMNNFDAYTIRSNRVRTDVGRGFKRFAGVTEAHVGAAGEVSPTMIENLSALCGILNDGVTYDDEGTTLSFSSVVLAFEGYTAPSGKPAYRPYETLAEQLDHMADGVIWAPLPLTTTQSSRKRKNG